ncbi:hypothetical protein [Aquimarina sp. 2201CG14-23]|uniref:hypothetical protein n=1 Tax=Aquimarina mycalae TaxID=3040073 RepID=UPI0024780570|nr:hypothetical protein [Aquimarina sp. 2201CG14-23]MDH7445310.1 hypothetical protein [Aquimarina sp. 2201CG14-23]
MTQKNKNIALIVSLLLVLGIAYQYGFAKTFAISKEVAKLENQKEVYESAPAQLAALANKEKQLNEILKKNNVEGNSLQNNILKVLNTLSGDSGFTIIAFEEPHIHLNEISQKTTTTYNFTLQGDYKSLINVVYALEQKYSFGNVINVHFEKKKNFRTGRRFLQCQILVQRIN